LALFLGFASTFAYGDTAPTQVEVVEYYNLALDHYFMTANPDEIAKLDAGVIKGWVRTNVNFKAISNAVTTPAGAAPVCRFYGAPAAGFDSHFYSASLAECAQVSAKFADAWLLESSNVFQVYLPDDSGKCPANMVPVMREWNNRADEGHRYTTNTSVADAMAARGYVSEGSGSPPVVMCAPLSTDVATPLAMAAPVCQVQSDASSPVVGSAITLTATCAPTPTAYVWTGCSSTGATCKPSGSTAGSATYGVSASNNAGAGPAATLAVKWLATSTPTGGGGVPVCTMSASSSSPTVGDTVTLTANCSGSPTNYTWTGCASNVSTCTATSSSAGPKSYTVTATNASGSGAVVNATMTWQAAATPPTTPPGGSVPACTVTANTLSPATGGSLVLTATCSNTPTSYVWASCGVLLQELCNPIPNCPSTASSCTTTSQAAGPAHYALQASNASGAAARVGIDVVWGTAASAVPSCQVTVSNATPMIGA